MPTNKKKRTAKKQKKNKTRAKPLTFEELVAAADEAVQSQPPTTDGSHPAVQLYTAALQLVNATDNVDRRDQQCQVLQKRAQVLVSLHETDAARRDYQEALQLVESTTQYDQRAALHLYIGQLSQGKDALDAYRQGMDALQALLVQQQQDASEKNDQDVESIQAAMVETQTQLAAACCSIAELYLTDLCFEENAESECESYIQQALKYTDASGEPGVDALQTVASLRLSQQRGIEAVESILGAYERMRVGCEALSSLVGLREVEASAQQQASELLELEQVQNLPGFEFRCQTAKLLLECADTCQQQEQQQQQDDSHSDKPLLHQRREKCVQAAIDVLGSLLAENDEVIEIWYLTGNAFAAVPNAEFARHYWEQALEMLTTVKQSLEQELLETDKEEEIEGLEQQLEEVTAQDEEIRCRLEELQDDNGANETEPMMEE